MILQNNCLDPSKILLSVQFKICDEKRKYLEQMKEIWQLNYIKADVDSLEIGDERQLELFLSNDDIKSSSRTDHYDYYYH